MKSCVRIIAVIVCITGVIMLFGETEALADQIWLWLKGAGLIGLSLLLYALTGKDETNVEEVYREEDWR